MFECYIKTLKYPFVGNLSLTHSSDGSFSSTSFKRDWYLVCPGTIESLLTIWSWYESFKSSSTSLCAACFEYKEFQNRPFAMFD